ncbi:hypothetical protein HGRIS_009531 [Hohenbuehelia grisea]|uniref:RRN7-type domain-containing protein n=1 Tax=Hohenbuehelia grisea TaxID=104357 RepID=A0ABR3J1V4_9AGAR
MAPRPRCPVCRSRQWHKEPASGLIACSEGHVLQNYRNEAADADEPSPYALRKRTLKSGRKKGEKHGKSDPKIYHGSRAQFHYAQCQQVILRLQIVALTREWDLPPEFEILCRDLWALYLSLLPQPLPAEPYYYAQELREGGDQGGNPDPLHRTSDMPVSPEMSTSPNNEGLPNEDRTEGSEGEETDDSDGSDSDDQDEAAQGRVEDPELAALLRENSESSSSSSSEADSDTEDKTEGKSKAPAAPRGQGKRKGKYTHEGLQSTLAVLLVALWMLRVPVVYADMRRLIEMFKLPYLDPLRLLPQNMSRHLTKYSIQSLSPAHAPQTLVLHRVVKRFSRRLFAVYGIFTPEANGGPILWRTVRCMGGTPSLYILTKRLAYILSLPLTLHHSLAPGLKKLKARDPDFHKYDDVPPELALAAAVIIVLKMIYGLDGKPRSAKNEDDPACWLPRVDEFLELVKQMDGVDAKGRDQVFSSTSTMRVDSLSDEMLDEYLSFCERALLGHEGDGKIGGKSVLERFFPLEGDRMACDASRGREAYPQPDLHANLPVESPHAGLGPGDEYKIYQGRDVLGNIGDDLEVVVARASQWVGVSNNEMLGVVETYERRVVRWWTNAKRRSREK